ncbi:MAG TPA: hypothetical protein VFA04_20665 [Bryobacteraceae bacterium]|nr:hypothetical protein [Bryobacteraceae bacterium]
MGAFAFSDHPVEDLIKKNLLVAGVLVRTAGNQRSASGAQAATANARRAYNRAQELVRTLPDGQRLRWEIELLALNTVLCNIECAIYPVDTRFELLPG